MKEKDHLKIDLEFLDKIEAPVAEPTVNTQQNSVTSHVSAPVSGGTGYGSKILIIVGIVLFFAWSLYSLNGGSSNVNSAPAGQAADPSGDENAIIVGEYSCSRQHYNYAETLDPDESEQQIESNRLALEYQSSELDQLQNQIENSYVNEYSDQWEIDQYNEMVDEYNSKLPGYKRDSANFELRVTKYNVQAAAYNNYLMANCTKRY